MMIFSSEDIDRARDFGRMLHRHQIDRDGKPHYEHCERVAAKLQESGAASIVIVVALLHDVLEDTDVSHEAIASEFGWNVAHVVDVLSRRDEETWSGYILRVLGCAAAVQVKIADIEDNIERCVPNDKMHKKLPMYTDTLLRLKEHTKLYPPLPCEPCTSAA